MGPGFPFHQGRFQGLWVAPACSRARCFHSTKEGFKGSEGLDYKPEEQAFPFHQGRFQGMEIGVSSQSRPRVSIPPRKVSRPVQGAQIVQGHIVFPFHQGRFQGVHAVERYGVWQRFPFHQGRFQGRSGTSCRTGRTTVSIPPRKVSREAGTGDAGAAERGFHSTKEGFKVGAGGPDDDTDRAFPFHQGRFQGQRLQRPRWDDPRFHSTKEGFKGHHLLS